MFINKKKASALAPLKNGMAERQGCRVKTGEAGSVQGVSVWGCGYQGGARAGSPVIGGGAGGWRKTK